MNTILFGEAIYYTRLAVRDDNNPEPNHPEPRVHFVNVALIRAFAPPDDAISRMSHTTVLSCKMPEAILVVPILDILSVVAMVPQGGNTFFCVEKPGLEVYTFVGGEDIHDDDDDDLDRDIK